VNLLFIICGSIAIKKCPGILKNLSDSKIYINCIITKNAQIMTKINKVEKIINGKIYLDSSEKNNKMLHIRLTRKADLIVVCPATANIIAKYANGYANDLASTALIASDKQVVFIPAMNVEMWNNSINQQNVLKLKKIGVEFVGPEYGYLSCKEIGLGRLSDTNKICEIILMYLNKSQTFKNKKCLVTAGPTVEAIDPIRYFSNHSSGKQGYEIARQLMLCGARVILISGPTNIQAPSKIKLINVKTAKEMHLAVKKCAEAKVDVGVFTAAVSDVSPKYQKYSKIKKEELNTISFKKNPDILKYVSSIKKNRPKIVIGFAAETDDCLANAELKLLSKKCDAIVVNKITFRNKIFGADENKVSIISKNKTIHLKKMTKLNVAKEIVQFIDNFIN